jgi:wyosine [tRNA(Phe)-imidazoG37] synthetase (radical SAM superfamily)
MAKMNRKYTYGPVPSRRLGFSLGIDIIPYKNCSFNCIYCQLGTTTNLTVERKEYHPPEAILREVEALLEHADHIDYLTFSGSGEPTLHSRISYMINELKKKTTIPIAVLTNGSLLYMPQVQTGILNADVVLPTLCTAHQTVFEKIHRSHPDISVNIIIDGLVEFRKLYKGKIWLEIMLIKGVNDSVQEIEGLTKVIDKISPDRIQLNTAVRPPSEKWVTPLSHDELTSIRKMINHNCEIIAHFKPKQTTAYHADIEKMINDTVKRRPVTADDIGQITGVHSIELLKYLEKLLQEKKIAAHEYKGVTYYEKYGN